MCGARSTRNTGCLGRREPMMRSLAIVGFRQAHASSTGGGGGNRTRVRKGSYESFYTLRRLVFLSRLDPAERQTGSRPARASRPSATGVASGPSRLVVASLSRFGRTAQETPQLKLRKPACCRWLFYFHRFNEVSGPRRATSASAFPSNPVRPHPEERGRVNRARGPRQATGMWRGRTRASSGVWSSSWGPKARAASTTSR
jgi:hypothetical protein